MMIPPGETIGILGGGQLGRMLAKAAAQLGYRVHVFAPEADSVAAEVCARFTHAQWDDARAMAEIAEAKAAWIGRALVLGCCPNSSRRCASNGSLRCIAKATCSASSGVRPRSM